MSNASSHVVGGRRCSRSSAKEKQNERRGISYNSSHSSEVAKILVDSIGNELGAAPRLAAHSIKGIHLIPVRDVRTISEVAPVV